MFKTKPEGEDPMLLADVPKPEEDALQNTERDMRSEMLAKRPTVKETKTEMLRTQPLTTPMDASEVPASE